ncbi:tetratricopeptide repeat protein [Rickettsia sibirica]|uniref:tetratricopeptide repeat protein n=1 Tax=Rickettsia sibirica TaxID=35793 RepID=UPI0003735949|nr:CDC27 family protein [Rickettsia sibirica]
MRNYKEVIDMYSKIHKSSNYYQEAQYYLGECYLNQEEFTEAVEAYNKVNNCTSLFVVLPINI